ncbi:MAG: AbrB/MazE/SpoVT family DNA-binding domain-containing protein [Aquificae bacterium]|nr:AbrB/MazE/SpoVT family DNA-binding domain-containing protein [Aquificota bacterium]
MPIAKITHKGQITIPAEYRKKLGTDIVEIVMEDDKLIIKPVRKLGGALHKYAIKNKPIRDIIREEKEVIGNALSEKHIND